MTKALVIYYSKTGNTKKMAESVAERLGKPVRLGRYVDISDSLHIYGSYFREIEGDPERGIQSFFETLKSRPFEERTWDSDFIKPFFIDDGVGKGLKVMLEREKEMPENVRKMIGEELRLMEEEGYVV